MTALGHVVTVEDVARGMALVAVTMKIHAFAMPMTSAAWAGFFVLRGAFPTTSSAYYFSLLQRTTVGTELTLPDRWRLLGGMIAISGALAFAWSTAVLLALARRFQDEQLRRRSVPCEATDA